MANLTHRAKSAPIFSPVIKIVIPIEKPLENLVYFVYFKLTERLHKNIKYSYFP